jgi:TP901 family phage tail tape measure protein
MFGGVTDIVARISLEGTDTFSSGLKKVQDNTSKTAQTLNTVLNVAMLATAGAITGSILAAAKFEESFAGVAKTVDGVRDSTGKLTDAGQKLQDGLRSLAIESGTSVNELNRIAEIGGQLGIANSDLLGFTKTVSMLGVTTDMSVEEASESMARFVNVTRGVAPAGMSAAEQISRIGSAVNTLGAASAAGEGEIMNFAGRLAGAGAQAGITQQQILAISASLASTGMNAELGGTAFSKLVMDMSLAVAKGGAKLEELANVAGKASAAGTMTGAEFKRAFEKDAAGTIITFLEGLKASGKDSMVALDKLGYTGAGLSQTLLKGAGSVDLFKKALDDSATSYSENSSLAAEFAVRSATTTAQFNRLKVIVNDLAITLGSQFLPAINKTLTIINEHPAALKAVAISVGSIVALTGGIQFFKKAWETGKATVDVLKEAFDGLKDKLSPVNEALGKSGASLGSLAIGVGAVVAVYAIFSAALERQYQAMLAEIDATSDNVDSVEALGKKLESTKEGTAAYTETTEALRKKLEESGINVDQYGMSLAGIARAFREIETERLKTQLKEIEDQIQKEIEPSNSWLRAMKVGFGVAMGNAGAFATDLKKATDKAEAMRKEIDQLTGAEKALADAGIQSEKSLRDKITTLEVARDKVQKGTYDYNQLTAQINDLKTKVGDTVEPIKKMTSTQDLLKESNIKLSSEVQKEVQTYERLYTAYGNDIAAKKQINDKLNELYEKLGMVNPHLSKQELLIKGLSDAGVDLLENNTKQIDKFSALSDQVEKGSGYYDQLTKKIKETIDKVVDTNAPIEKQISQLQDVRSKLVEGSTGYQMVEDRIVSLMEEMDRSNSAIDAQKTGLQMLTDAGIELTSSVREQIANQAALIPVAKELGDAYGEKQLLGNIKSLYEKIGDTKGWEAFVAQAGISQEQVEGLSQKSEKGAKDWTEYAGQIGDVAKKFLGLGDTGSKAVDLLTSTVTGFLKGGLDPVSLGLQAASLLMDVLGGSAEKTGITVNDMKDSLGDLGTQITTLDELVNNLANDFESKLLTSLNNTNQAFLVMVTIGANMKNMGEGFKDLGEKIQKEFTDKLKNNTAELERLTRAFTFDNSFTKATEDLQYLIDVAAKNQEQFGKADWGQKGLADLINENVQGNLRLLATMDPTSDAYKKMTIQVWEAQATMAVLRGEVSSTEQWFENLAIRVEGTGDEMLAANYASERATEGQKTFADSIQESIEKLGGLTTALADAVKSQITDLGSLADKAIEMKNYYGDIKFPQMTADLEAAIAGNQAVLATLDPASQAYKDLADNIFKAQYALAVMNGYQGEFNSWLLANNLQLNNTGEVIEKAKSAQEKFNEAMDAAGVETQASVLKQVQSWTLLAAQLDVNSYEYRQLYDKIGQALSKLVDSNAPIDEQIKQWYALATTMQIGSAEYQVATENINSLIQKLTASDTPLADQIKMLEGVAANLSKDSIEYENVMMAIDQLREKLSQSNVQLTEHQELLKKLSELGIETTDGVMEQINAYSELLPKLQAGSYEYQQVMDKLDGLYGKLLDSSAPLREQISGLEALRDSGVLSGDALVWVTAKLAELNEGMQKQKIAQDAEKMGEEFEKAGRKLLSGDWLSAFEKSQKGMTDLADNAVQLRAKFGDIKFPSMERDLQAAIIDNKGLLATLDPTSVAYRELQDSIWKSEAALAVLRGEVGSIDEYFTKYNITLSTTKTVLDAMANGAEATFAALHELAANFLESIDITGLTSELSSAFDSSRQGLGSLADELLRVKEYFNMPTGEMEQALAQAIADNQALLGTLNPTSQAYRDLQDEIWKAQAALAVARGEVASIDEYLRLHNITLNNTTAAVQTFQEQFVDAFQLGIGLTEELGNQFKDTVKGLGDLADRALEMKKYFGDIEFPQMTADLEAAIANNQALLATLDPTSQAYKDLSDNIYKAQYALAVMNGFQGTLNEWLIANNLALNNAAEPLQTLIDQLLAATAATGGLTAELADAVTSQITGLGSLADKALELKNYYGNIKFPQMTADLEAAIANNQALLATLDPQSQAYRDLADNIYKAQYALAVMNGFQGDFNQWLLNNNLHLNNQAAQIETLADQFKAAVESTTGITAELGAAFDSSLTGLTSMAEEAIRLKKYFGEMPNMTIETDLLNTIQQNQALLATLDPQSQAYRDMADAIMQAQYAVAVLNGYQGTLNEWLLENNLALNNAAEPLQTLVEQLLAATAATGGLTTELADAVTSQITGLGSLAEKALELKNYYGNIQFPQMTADLQAAIADNQALLATLDPQSQAYKDLTDNIYKAQYALAVMNGYQGTLNEWLIANNLQLNSMAADLKNKVEAAITDLNKTIADLEKEKISLEVEFNANREKIEFQIMDIQKSITDKLKEKSLLTHAFEIDRAKITSNVKSLNEILARMGSNTPPNLYEIQKLLEGISGQTHALVINWGEMLDTLFADYDQFSTDFDTATKALDKLTYFKIDFNTTGADEQINAMIFRMQDFLATLDPNSQAYKDMAAQLEELKKKFTDAGGVLDENAAKDAVKQEAIDQIEALKKKLDELYTTYNNKQLEIDLEITEFENQLKKLEDDLNTLIDTYNQKKIEIDLDLTKAYAQLQALMEWLAAANNGTPPPTPPPLHTGGFGYDVTAHTGLIAADEVIAKLKRNEVVIPEGVVSKYPEPNWRQFISTGDPNVFPNAKPATSNVDLNFDVIVHSGDPSAWVEFKKKSERWYRDRSKNITTVTSFGRS